MKNATKNFFLWIYLPYFIITALVIFFGAATDSANLLEYANVMFLFVAIVPIIYLGIVISYYYEKHEDELPRINWMELLFVRPKKTNKDKK